MQTLRGFSLLQVLLVTIVIGIISSTAAPSWSRLVRNKVVDSYVSRLNVLLLRARMDALLRQLPVHLCAVNLKSNQDVQGCLGSPRRIGGEHVWEEGALLFQDRSGGRQAVYDSKEAISVLPFRAGDTALQFTASAPRFEIGEWGGLKGIQSIRFTVQDHDGTCQQLLVEAPLRIRVMSC